MGNRKRLTIRLKYKAQRYLERLVEANESSLNSEINRILSEAEKRDSNLTAIACHEERIN